MSVAGTSACSRTHHSWKCTTRPSASATWVCTGSSDIGISVTPGCQRWHSAAVAADSGWPAASRLVRAMCVAKSLSPSWNQSGPAR